MAQLVYDSMINAAKWAHNTYGAQLIQRRRLLHVQLGDMDPDHPLRPRGVQEENHGREHGVGVGQRPTGAAFLASDLMDTEADPDSTHNGFEGALPGAVGHVDP